MVYVAPPNPFICWLCLVSSSNTIIYQSAQLSSSSIYSLQKVLWVGTFYNGGWDLALSHDWAKSSMLCPIMALLVYFAMIGQSLAPDTWSGALLKSVTALTMHTMHWGMLGGRTSCQASCKFRYSGLKQDSTWTARQLLLLTIWSLTGWKTLTLEPQISALLEEQECPLPALHKWNIALSIRENGTVEAANRVF